MGRLNELLTGTDTPFHEYLHADAVKHVRAIRSARASDLLDLAARPPDSVIGHGPKRSETCSLSDTPVFVLNLDRRKDRIQNLSSLLQAKMPWMRQAACRVDAPDGQSLGDSLNPSVIDPSAWRAARTRSRETMGGPLTKGSAALMMGHARIWERVAHGEAPWAVVMEDDINYVNPKLGDFLCELKQEHEIHPNQDTWDVIQLQQPGNRQSTERMQMDQGSNHHLGMYVLTKNAAKRLLQKYFPIGLAAEQLDSPGGFLRTGLRVFKSNPPGALQVGSETDTDAQIPGQSCQGNQKCIWSASNARAADGIRDCGQLPASEMVVPGLDNKNLLKFL